MENSPERIKLNNDGTTKIKPELIETIPDIQSDYYFPNGDSASDSDWDDDPESKIKLSKLKDQEAKKSEKSYPCDICNKNFTQKSHLLRHCNSQAHLNIVNDPSKSDFNAKTPDEKLDQIIDTDNIKKEDEEDYKLERGVQFKCSFCTRKFNLKKCFELHMRLHRKNNKKSKSCDICKKTFKHGRYLAQHIKNCHSAITSHICQICNERFPKGKIT